MNKRWAQIGLALLLVGAFVAYFSLGIISKEPSNATAATTTSAARQVGPVAMTIGQLARARLYRGLGAFSIEYDDLQASNPIEVQGRISDMVIEGVIHMPDGPTPDESYAVPVIAIEDNGQLAFVHPGAKKASAPFGEFYIGERVKVIGSFVGNHSCKSNSDKECSLLHIRDQEFVPDIIVMPVDGETIVHQI